MSPRYRVDTTALLGFIERLGVFAVDAEQIATAVEQLTNELHTTWEGQGAEAHQGYHELWMTAMAEMREGLAVLRSNADVAHDNYTGVARHNTAMWP